MVRLGALGEDAGLEHVEGDLGVDAVGGDLDVLHLSDADAGDPDVVPGGQAGDVGEHRAVGGLVAELDVGDGGRERRRWRAG